MNKQTSNNKAGFTLIEIMITIAISSIVMLGLYQTFSSQQQSYILQEEVATMQQELRTSMLLLASDLRMAGFDRMLTGGFGILNVEPRDTSNNEPAGDGIKGIIDTVNSVNSNDSIVMTMDIDEDGVVDADERIQYQIYDFVAGDGHLDLGRQTGNNASRLLAESIQKLGIAYAFDNDLDGELDTYTVGAGTTHVYWGFDFDGDNQLDRHLDNNLDGTIDVVDSPGGVGGNSTISGQVIPGGPVPLNRIRAVRVWLLAETEQAGTGYNEGTTYTVGRYVITPANNRRMRLLTTIIKCRNL